MSRWLIASEEKQLSDYETDKPTPEGLFKKSAETIVRTLLSMTKGDIGKAIQKITFYINRAGDNLSNAQEVKKAKKILQDRLEKEKKD
jgi:hypothetical protein